MQPWVSAGAAGQAATWWRNRNGVSRESRPLDSDGLTVVIRNGAAGVEWNSVAGHVTCKAGIILLTQGNSKEAFTLSVPTERDEVLSPCLPSEALILQEP